MVKITHHLPYNLSTDPSILQKFAHLPRTDPHCHTIYSDGCTTLTELIRKAKKLGFAVVMKADHNTTKGNTKLKQLAQDAGILSIPAIEISANGSHIVGINVETWPYGKIPVVDCIDKIHAMNGIAIAGHPWWKIGLRESVFRYKDFDGFEALNHSSPIGSLQFVRKIYPAPSFEKINPHRIPCWVGSDSHANVVYGKYQMIFHTEDWSVDGILEAMRKKRVTAFGQLFPFYWLIADGWINQPAQLKRELFYRHVKTFSY